MELRGFEPLTFSLRTRRATDCAIAPRTGRADQHADFTTGSGRPPGLRRGGLSHIAAATPTPLPLQVQRSAIKGSQVIAGQPGGHLGPPPGYADATSRVSSPSASGWASATASGASAVTGTWGRAVTVTPGPDRSMVRTVRGASGLET